MRKLKLLLFLIYLCCALNLSTNGSGIYTPPGIEWRRSDFLSRTPDIVNSSPRNSPLSRDNGSHDWWYDAKVSYDNLGNPDGYIVCGYSGPFNWQLKEQNNGCYYISGTTTTTCNVIWPTVGASRIESYPNPFYPVLTTSTQTIAKYDLFGNQLWMKTYNEGTFNKIIQTSDGNYLAIGGSKSTRAADGITPLPYNLGQSTTTTINCTGTPTNARHISVVKIDPSGNIIFNNLYGEVLITSSLFPSSFAEGMEAVEFNIGSSTPLYRLVGHHSNGSSAYEQSVIIDIGSTTGTINAGPQNFTTGTDNLKFECIDVYGSFPNEIFAVGGAKESSSEVGYLAYFPNSTITTTPVTQTFTDNVSLDADAYSVAFDLSGNILLGVVEDVQDYSSFNGETGEAAVYKLYPPSLPISSPPKVLISSYLGSYDGLRAFDLRLGVTKTNDGGFAVCTTKRLLDYSTQWGAVPTACVCSTSAPIKDCWNTDTYVAKYDNSTTPVLEWEKTFDVDDAAPSTDDARKKECVFSIKQTSEGGYIVAGTSSYNADDNFLAKLYPDCQSREEFDIVGMGASHTYDITSSTTWSSSASVIGSVVVHTGATLTISGLGTVIQFADTKRTGIVTNIIVEIGAHLIVTDNALLTSDLHCDDAMWDGIQVYGDPGKVQYAIYQGRVDVTKNAIIENARTGILAGEAAYSTHNNFQPNVGSKISSLVMDATGVKGGAIVYCDHANFHNNRKSVVFDPYGATMSNNSRIQYSSFLNDAYMRDRFFVDNAGNRIGNNTFVTLNGTKAMGILNSTFENSIALTDLNVLSRGTAIAMANADAYITGNRFTTNTYGITAKNYYTSYSVLVDKNDFHNNFGGIRNSGVTGQRLTRNNFTVGLDLTPNEYGIYLEDGTGYAVEENVMINSNSSNPAQGIVDNYTSNNTNYNILYRNSFDSFDYGMNFENQNRGDMSSSGYPFPYEGLKFKCNSFANGKNYDAATTLKPGVSVLQGGNSSPSDAANNTFSNTCNWSDANLSEIFSNGYYIYYFNLGISDPTACYGLTYITALSTTFSYDESQCPTNFADPCKPPCDDKYQSYKTIYDSLFDVLNGGGDEEHRMSSLSSENDSLEQLLAVYRANYELAFNQLVSYYTLDTAAANPDSVITLLQRDRNPGSRLRLLDFYMSENRLDSAAALLNVLCMDAQYENYCILMNLLLVRAQDSLPVEGLRNSTSRGTIETIASDTTQYGFILARNLLSYLDETTLPEVIATVPQSAARKAVEIHAVEDNKILHVYPNPAYDNITIEIESSSLIHPSLIISDASGKMIKTIQLSGESRIIISQNELNGLGVYFVKLIDTGKTISVEKLILLQ